MQCVAGGYPFAPGFFTAESFFTPHRLWACPAKNALIGLTLLGNPSAFPSVFNGDHKNNRSDIHRSATKFWGFLAEFKTSKFIRVRPMR
ncbi:hypothetical protein [Serratia marcescens]|uniref:hypothetical protein n=1 Tax=Serratia marcescens TaxID=615 RepID=UPI001114C898|nr:hypothetical protein [Serratia marcescens]